MSSGSYTPPSQNICVFARYDSRCVCDAIHPNLVVLLNDMREPARIRDSLTNDPFIGGTSPALAFSISFSSIRTHNPSSALTYTTAVHMQLSEFQFHTPRHLLHQQLPHANYPSCRQPIMYPHTQHARHQRSRHDWTASVAALFLKHDPPLTLPDSGCIIPAESEPFASSYR
jgi:hypothetical protein